MDNFVKRYMVITYGCQMNLHESEKIAGILESEGYVKCDEKEQADIIVFNTCCIRENAENTAEGNIGALKGLKRKKKDMIIAVGGCMTQQKGFAERLHKTFPFVDIVFGTHNLENFRELLKRKLLQKKTVIEILNKETDIVEGTPRARDSFPNGWINISYGCNNFCSYCIVPYVRGRERSRKPEEIIKEAKQLISEGYKEITLLGQNVNSYGKDINTDFPTLLSEICKIDGDFRLRFMTNHPKDLSEDMVKVMAKEGKICRSVHLPVQAGSNRILKLMNRKYTREDYFSKVDLLRKYIPDISVTTDVMVGFPTETEEDFADTVDLVKRVGFAGAFTFIYSRREGTPAAIMEGQIDESIGKKRVMELIDLQNGINKEQSKEYLGKTITVLCEGYDEKRGKYLGRDTYGRMAYFDGEQEDFGNFIRVKITETGGISLLGEKVKG